MMIIMEGFENCYQFEIPNPDRYISAHAPLRGCKIAVIITPPTNRETVCKAWNCLRPFELPSQGITDGENYKQPIFIFHNSGGAGKSKIKVSADIVFGMI